MKKKIITLLTTICIFGSLMACGKEETSISSSSTNSNETMENVENTEDTDNVNDEVVEEVETNKFQHWFKTVKWNENSEGFINSLYNENFKLPIDLHSLDELSNPYSYYVDGFNNAKAYSIQEILNDSRVCENEIKLFTSNDKENRITNIYFVNYNPENKLSSQQCYDNNWWYIEAIYNLNNVLNIDSTMLSNEYASDKKEAPLLDAIIEKYGKPSYILTSDAYKEDINNPNEELWLWYDLVYEYNDYVITMMVQDQPMSEYNTHMIVLHAVKYYTKDCWNKELEKKPITDEIIINDISCKFQKTN